METIFKKSRQVFFGEIPISYCFAYQSDMTICLPDRKKQIHLASQQRHHKVMLVLLNVALRTETVLLAVLF